MKNLRKRGRVMKEERDFQSCNHNTVSNSKITKLWHIPSQAPCLHFGTEKRMGKK
jgi:hypothetical protein